MRSCRNNIQFSRNNIRLFRDVARSRHSYIRFRHDSIRCEGNDMWPWNYGISPRHDGMR